ncbi:MAG: alanine--tRNA ligase-related protein [Candidatus Saccharibacteria bacterium]|nr:alanine--tRNA ligase-related protein [Candidatus Saccharibacteria bacterium]
MNADDIRRKFLKCAEEHGHVIIPRAKVVPEDDNTTLFTGSGMQPLLKYLLGKPHHLGTRLADTQTCVRAQDIDEVGDNRHTTFFEMLGNWSLGDYFKRDQITWFFNFLVDEVGLDPNHLYVTCFQGDPENNVPRDEEAATIWQELFAERGIKAEIADMGSEAEGGQRGMKDGERIFFYDGSKNWWSRNGGPATTPIGDPCGPDSEVFYMFDHVEHDEAYGHHCHPNCDCGRFMEIGNQVFTQYVRTETGFDKLANKNVDFGGGLERIAAAAINSPDVFKTSLFTPIITKLEEIGGKKYDDYQQSMRVIADHLRAATFLAVDGVRPSNKQQGYVMRRLIRRAIRFAFDLGVEQNFMEEIVPVIADVYHEDFPEVGVARDEIVAVLAKEEKAFRRTLAKGLREFDKMSADGLTGTEVFKLYDTYGFPVELSVEEAAKRGIAISDTWRADFNELMNRQRQLSQASVKKF